MIKVLGIVIVNLGFTINFYKIIAKVKIYKRVKLVFLFKLSTKWLQQFSQVGFTCFLHGLTSFILVSGIRSLESVRMAKHDRRSIEPELSV